MQKKNIIISSALTIALCLTLIAGSTFALFTSEDSVDISVTSANVNITAEVTGTLALSSLGIPQTDYFANGGSAEYVDGVLTLLNATPGDAVEFDIEVTNLSNIDVMYRVTWDVGGILSEVLTAEADGIAVTPNSTEWTEWKVSDPTTKVIHVSLELPVETGNLYQNQRSDIVFKVEAVQKNAASDTVGTEDQLKAAIELGTPNIILTSDVELTEALVIPQGTQFSLDLADHIINGKIENNGELTVTNSASSSSLSTTGAADVALDKGTVKEIVNNGELVFNGGIAVNVVNNGELDVNAGFISGSLTNNATLTVNGGEITAITNQNDGVAVINAGTVGKIEGENVTVNGGSFGEDPADYLADGLTLVVVDGKFVVVSNEQETEADTDETETEAVTDETATEADTDETETEASEETSDTEAPQS